MSTKKVDGFEVKVLDGREITEGEFAKLSPDQQSKVKAKVNGPHHNALWARHRRNRRCLQHAFTLPWQMPRGKEVVT